MPLAMPGPDQRSVAVFQRPAQMGADGQRRARLSGHAELETILALARGGTLAAAADTPTQVSGQVRITSTDGVLYGVVAPAIAPLTAAHPGLSLEFVTGNELVSLTRRDTLLAVRATHKPPPHLVGRRIGPIRVAVYAARRLRLP